MHLISKRPPCPYCSERPSIVVVHVKERVTPTPTASRVYKEFNTACEKSLVLKHLKNLVPIKIPIQSFTDCVLPESVHRAPEMSYKVMKQTIEP